VRVQFMRWDSHGWEPFAPNNVTDIRAGLDQAGKLVAYDFTSWLPNGSAPNPGLIQIGNPIPARSTGSTTPRGAPDTRGITTNNSPSAGASFQTFASGDAYFPNIPNRRVLGKTVEPILTNGPVR